MNDFLKTLAPLLGTAIAGPFAGIAATFIAEKLGIPEKTVTAVTDALNPEKITPDQAAAIKLAELDFKKWCGENQLKKEQLTYEDSKSARDMQMTTRSHLPAVLATLVIGGFAVVTILKILGATVAQDPTIQDLLTTLRDAVILVLSFYFGSSHTEQTTTELLHQSTPLQGKATG
jgi:hypothetical protein